MTDKDADLEEGLRGPGNRFREIQLEYRAASLRAGSDAGKEAMRKLHHDRESVELLRELPMPLYAPPDGREGGRKDSTPEEAEEGPVLEFGDEINPPYEPTRRHDYRELGAFSYTGCTSSGCGEWGGCEQRIDPPGRGAKEVHAWAIAGGYEHMPDLCRVYCGFRTVAWVDDYVWEWLTVKSRMNAYFSEIQADTRDFSPASQPNPTYALVGAQHVLHILLDNRFVANQKRILVSHDLGEAEQHHSECELTLNSEITAKIRVLRGKVVKIYESVELEVASDGWAKIEGIFTWRRLQTWWDGLGLSQADLDPRFKLEDIFRRAGD